MSKILQVARASAIAVVNCIPAAGSPVPVSTPESMGAPLTTETARWLSYPVKVLPSGRVPVKGRSKAARVAATVEVGAEGAALAAPASPKMLWRSVAAGRLSTAGGTARGQPPRPVGPAPRA
jgi:hypothetical protein